MSLPPEGSSQLLVVLGSVTPPGRLRLALEHAVERARARGLAVDLLDLGERRVAFADGRDPAAYGDDTASVVNSIAAADGLVFATPVYRGSMTGALKNLFDQLPVPALAGKPVGTVAMGASDHHYLGSERHLRDIYAFFGVFALPVAVYLTNRDFTDGVPGERAAAVLDELLDGLDLSVRSLGAAARKVGPASLASAAIRS